LEYVIQGKTYQTHSSLLVKGSDALRTAMAKTVGLPLGISAKLLLTGALKLKGVVIPVLPEIYMPVLKALEKQGIQFDEETNLI
jgi:saccharopine dehydrogenase-like NADP-dependent oxidoreductase